MLHKEIGYLSNAFNTFQSVSEEFQKFKVMQFLYAVISCKSRKLNVIIEG